MGFFYGGNIAGAVLGCLLAGFYLLRVFDMTIATYVAASLNFIVGTSALLMARRARPDLPVDDAAPRRASKPSRKNEATRPSRPASATVRAPGARMIYVIIAISGFTGLGAEVVWTRLLSLLLGGTVYTFSIILAVFLIGLGIGSGAGSILAGWTQRPRLLLGFCQLLLAGAIAWTAYMLTRSLPYWPIDPSLSGNIWFNFQLDLMRCLWALLPATCLWGASFPLALASVAARGQDPGKLVGTVYAANTLGAILGAVGFSLLVIAHLGSQGAQQVLIGAAALAGFLALAPLLWSGLGRERSFTPVRITARLAGAVGLILGLTLAGWLVGAVPAVPPGLIAWGRYLASKGDPSKPLFVGEGMNASVAVTGVEHGSRYFHVAGKVEASTDPQDMRLQRMLGHIPALLHPRPRSVLVVGCGAGVTAGSFVIHPDVERITICEIEPLIPDVVSRFFSEENYNVVNDRRVRIVYDDARHFVLTTDQKFDIITSDPINPWVKGAATLYTREYFEMCRRRLAPGGIVTQWVPLYESTEEAVKSEIATFLAVFPNGTVWSNDSDRRGYDIVLLGQEEPMKIDVDALGERLRAIEYQKVRQSLREVGFHSAVEILATYSGRRQDLAHWLANAQINRDRNLRLQYLAGVGLNNYYEEYIYDDMIAHREYPDDLFVASKITRQILRDAIMTPRPAR